MSKDNNDFPEVNQLLRSKWLRNYINNRIHTLRLSSYLSGEDLIQYVAECLTKKLQSGTKVEYPIAWAKLVSERHINHLYKKNRKSEATESNRIEYLANLRSQESSLHSFDNREHLYQSIQLLKPSSRQIVEMRFFQEMHWDKIADILSCQEDRPICAATARKRGERALNELRQIYLKSWPDTGS